MGKEVRTFAEACFLVCFISNETGWKSSLSSMAIAYFRWCLWQNGSSLIIASLGLELYQNLDHVRRGGCGNSKVRSSCLLFPCDCGGSYWVGDR